MTPSRRTAKSWVRPTLPRRMRARFARTSPCPLVRTRCMGPTGRTRRQKKSRFSSQGLSWSADTGVLRETGAGVTPALFLCPVCRDQPRRLHPASGQSPGGRFCRLSALPPPARRRFCATPLSPPRPDRSRGGPVAPEPTRAVWIPARAKLSTEAGPRFRMAETGSASLIPEAPPSPRAPRSPGAGPVDKAGVPVLGRGPPECRACHRLQRAPPPGPGSARCPVPA